MHRTGAPAAPLRAAVRWLTAALLACAAMLGGATAAHAAPPPPPAAAAHGTGSHAPGHGGRPGPGSLCPAHQQDGPGTGDGGCGSADHMCLPASAPPMPYAVPVPAQPAWLVWVGSPDGRGLSSASEAGPAGPDLTELCVSRT